MNFLFKAILFVALITGLFFFFCSVEMMPAGDGRRVLVRTKKSADGFVVYIKPGVWEVWSLDNNSERAKIFPAWPKMIRHVFEIQKRVATNLR